MEAGTLVSTTRCEAQNLFVAKISKEAKSKRHSEVPGKPYDVNVRIVCHNCQVCDQTRLMLVRDTLTNL